MAFFETTRTAGLASAGRPSLISTALGRLAAWNEARITRRALERLSDHELDDIGLCRGDIDHIANGSFRR
ncbi:DUF1127 domain-containing protein [Frigidibacter sp. ROC022]|uniref:DUF1127 domain-containing protein n=1 Tax=Frigidibacter sp. ROC022 TaxID=2971796 RepID=UPI00215B17B7|nr:DUF1127 domain-containing protein [Frigidibacter sp. ROC022]MCR8725131.1 DUF1127 domain-containing protein [Frigidibacter sp. ROC022]